MIYLKLFFSFLQIGMFSVGGGYAAMPLIQEQAVEANHWLTMGEFTDLITIAEMTPGPIAVNSATFVGIRIAGLPGAIAATFGCILPSCFIVSLLAHIYYKYKGIRMIQSVLDCLRPAVVALIASAGISMLEAVLWDQKLTGVGEAVWKNTDWVGLLLFVGAFGALRKWKKSPIAVMCACGALSLLLKLMIQM